MARAGFQKVDAKPLRDVVIVWQPEEAYKGRIAIPDELKAKVRAEQASGIAIAVGPGTFDRFGQLLVPAIEPGDLVLFSKFAGVEFTVKGQRYLFIEANRDIYAVIPQKKGKAPAKPARKKLR